MHSQVTTVAFLKSGKEFEPYRTRTPSLLFSTHTSHLSLLPLSSPGRAVVNRCLVQCSTSQKSQPSKSVHVYSFRDFLREKSIDKMMKEVFSGKESCVCKVGTFKIISPNVYLSIRVALF